MIDFDGTVTFAMSVADRARSAAWYERHLGFTKAFDAEATGWTEMNTPIAGVTMGFGDAMQTDAGNAMPVFGVRSLEAARTTLEAGGVTFTSDTVEHPGMVRLATFADPDGNLLMLAENLAA